MEVAISVNMGIPSKVVITPSWPKEVFYGMEQAGYRSTGNRMA